MNIKNRKEGFVLIGKYTVKQLLQKFGSPLYIYDEQTLRTRCREIKQFCSLPNFKINYSVKANTSIALLQIIRNEGIGIDAMTLGEVYLGEQAGYASKDILFLSNNVSRSTLQTVIQKKMKVCVDSLTQLELFCELNPGGNVFIRLNPQQGAGHHEKVITAGKVKFGIEYHLIDEAIHIANAKNVTINGFTIHIGSLFLKPDIFHESVLELLSIAEKYPQIETIDFGGGFGIPYDRSREQSFPLKEYGQQFTDTLKTWMQKTGRNPTFAIQPGRFIVGESGICLTTVESTKINGGIHFVGTDLGFNFLLRPEMYGAYHEIIHASKIPQNALSEKVTITGNICESGDILGKDRILPKCEVGDILLIRDTGAYGFSMSSNYNSMCRPAELLLQTDAQIRLIRQVEDLNSLSRFQIY